MHDGALHHCTHAAAGAGRIRWRAASLMARRRIARLQQRALAASAAAGAGCIKWRAASLMARHTIARLQQLALTASD
jgi:hypothetical protein